MQFPQRIGKILGGIALLLVCSARVMAQSYGTNGLEYLPIGAQPGEQIHPSVSMNRTGGILAWQDNIANRGGYDINFIRLDRNSLPSSIIQRANQLTNYDEEKPVTALFSNNSAIVVWQGGKQSFQHIYARIISPTNTFVTGDVLVNTTTNKYQQDAAVAALTNGTAIVVWASRGQDNSDGLYGVYGQLLTTNGTKIGGEFLVNQTTPYSQRTPAVAALANGNFVVAWVSELQNAGRSVDIYARLFGPTGSALSGEFKVNTTTNVCANPAVVGAADGSFLIAWSEKNLKNLQNNWDVFARAYSSIGSPGNVVGVNTQLYGDQFAPKLAANGSDYMAVWTSMGQDGSQQGVFGQFLHEDATHNGTEFQVNTTYLFQQYQPSIACDGNGRFLAVWSTYAGGLNSLDLAAQRFSSLLAPLIAPNPPAITAIDSSTLGAAWQPLIGFNIDHWDLFVDGSATPYTTVNTYWQNESVGAGTNDYNAGSTHSFQLAYVLTDGRESPLSISTNGTTWGADHKSLAGNRPDGLPDDWETKYWGSNTSKWLDPNTFLAPGVNVWNVFYWGANPNDPSTWLTTKMFHTPTGWYLSWNAIPGELYQVETSTDVVNWTNVGGPQYAFGNSITNSVGLSNHGYYRVLRVIY